MQVVKALTYQLKQTARTLSHIKGNPLFIMYPVIVFDGHLFEYTSGEVKPVKYLEYLFRHRFRDPRISELGGDVFLIDVLRKNFLPKYLEMLKEEINVIKSKLTSWSV